MTKVDWENLDAVNRQIRIKELKKQVEKLGPILSGESETLSSIIQETFWQRVLSFEQAPRTTLFLQLIDLGVEMPDPKEMNEDKLESKLSEVIYRLAELKTYIESTGHLSDRELYTMLWSDILHQGTVLLHDDATCRRIDLIGSGSEQDTFLWLKYYADEESRSAWIKQFPDSEMPPHEDPPYSRDHQMPHP
jgi:hypothetical protein